MAMSKRGKRRAQGSSAGRPSGTLADQLRAFAAQSGDAEMQEAVRRADEEERRPKEAERPAERKKTIYDWLVLPLDPRRGIASGAFVNPYTFAALEEVSPERVSPADGQGTLSGKLSCSFVVQEWSPLFVPNTSKVFEDGGHKSYDFCSRSDLRKETAIPAVPPSDPYVPASEVRGMVRSVYEMLTNSCLSVLDEKSRPIKRTSLPKNPYRMEYDAKAGEWVLFPTEVYKLGAVHRHGAFVFYDARGGEAGDPEGYLKEHYCDGSLVEVDADVGSASWHKGSRYVGEAADPALGRCQAGHGYQRCRIHVTGEIGGGRNHNHITLYPAGGTTHVKAAARLTEDDPRFDGLRRVLDAYCEQSTSSNHNQAIACYKAYRRLLDGHKTVLVYADDELAHLAPSCISPEVFQTSVADLAADHGPNHANHAPCKGPELCPACSLFGTVAENVALGSRVRFLDATPDEESGAPVFLKPITLPPLSSPRPSATEFYLRRPAGEDRGVWNYDYLLQDRKKKATPYRELPGAGLQGRKAYLHHPFSLGRQYDGSQLQPSKQNVTVRPLGRGTFRFDVHFERLTREELANLVFAIGGFEGRLQKLGHGKPLGMGSVLMKVDSCTEWDYRYDVASNTVSRQDIPIGRQAIEASLPSDDINKSRRQLVRTLALNLDEVPAPAGSGGRTLGSLVSYPKTRPGRISSDRGSRNLSYEWFGKNRDSVGNPSISRTLGTLSVEDVGPDGLSFENGAERHGFGSGVDARLQGPHGGAQRRGPHGGAQRQEPIKAVISRVVWRDPIERSFAFTKAVPEASGGFFCHFGKFGGEGGHTLKDVADGSRIVVTSYGPGQKEGQLSAFAWHLEG